MRDDLLGYLLSALEPHEMREIEQALREDPELREQLRQCELSLGPLDRALASEPVQEPPPDLISRTMTQIGELPGGCDVLPALRPASARSSSLAFRWADLLAVAAATAAIFALLIPSIARGRYEARKITCQDHLRQLGTAITQYVLLNGKGELPQLAEAGPEAFSGMYAVRLFDCGLLDRGDNRWCPALDLPSEDLVRLALRTDSTGSSLRGLYAGMTGELPHRLITRRDLRRALDSGRVDWLKAIQRIAGGHYAYNLGVVDGDRYVSPRYEGRSTFVILGDAPIGGAQSADGVDVSRLKWGHGDDGANLLFEDGSVRYLNVNAMLEMPDHPYINSRGSIEAGVNIDDSVLGPSWLGPFISAKQR